MSESIVISLIAVAFAFPVWSTELAGIVTEVQDGDSLTLVNWQATYKIRLADIDAPEWEQPRGKDSAPTCSIFAFCGGQ